MSFAPISFSSPFSKDCSLLYIKNLAILGFFLSFSSFSFAFLSASYFLSNSFSWAFCWRSCSAFSNLSFLSCSSFSFFISFYCLNCSSLSVFSFLSISSCYSFSSLSLSSSSSFSLFLSYSWCSFSLFSSSISFFSSSFYFCLASSSYCFYCCSYTKASSFLTVSWYLFISASILGVSFSVFALLIRHIILSRCLSLVRTLFFYGLFATNCFALEADK
jgi:hypothetical protein